MHKIFIFPYPFLFLSLSHAKQTYFTTGKEKKSWKIKVTNLYKKAVKVGAMKMAKSLPRFY